MLSCIASAQRTARSAWSACTTGAPKYAMIPSPMNLSRVPPNAKICATMRPWHSFRSATTSSHASDSLSVVKSRMSLKSTVTSRASPAPTVPVASSRSATCGEK